MGLEGLVTVEKIRAAINASLSGLSNSDATITITKNDNTTSTITINNVANATTATTATKLGSSTVGSGVKAIYLNAGTATESNSTVGDSTTPVYLNAGAITACAASIGSGWTVSTGSAGWARENSTGFTIQWGDQTTFPRTFTTAFQVVMQTNNNKGEQLYKNQVTVTAISNNGFTIGSPGQGQRYVAFGIS
jgi:hypothetical protein